MSSDTPDGRSGLCDQSTYETIRVTVSGLRDLFEAIVWEMDHRPHLPGEARLVADVEVALEACIRVQNTVEANAVEELVWGKIRIPQARQGEQS